MWRDFRKSFNIDLKESLSYPIAKVICDTILKDQKEAKLLMIKV